MASTFNNCVNNILCWPAFQTFTNYPLMRIWWPQWTIYGENAICSNVVNLLPSGADTSHEIFKAAVLNFHFSFKSRSIVEVIWFAKIFCSISKSYVSNMTVCRVNCHHVRVSFTICRHGDMIENSTQSYVIYDHVNIRWV